MCCRRRRRGTGRQGHGTAGSRAVGREQEENTAPARPQQGGGRTLRWGASTSTQSCKRCSKCRMKPMLSLVAEVLICSQRVCERGTGSVSTRRTTHQPVNDERQLLGRCRRHKIIGRCHALVCQLVDRKRQRVLGHVPMHWQAHMVHQQTATGPGTRNKRCVVPATSPAPSAPARSTCTLYTWCLK